MADLKGVMKRLQKDIGKSPEVEIDEFVNWATTRKIKDLLVVKPTSLEEVQNVVKAAAKTGVSCSVYYIYISHVVFFLVVCKFVYNSKNYCMSGYEMFREHQNCYKEELIQIWARLV